MKSLFLRIWLTVVAGLALFALVSGWLFQRHLNDERERFDRQVVERMSGWAQLIQNSLPEASAPIDVQGRALEEWSTRMRLPLALEDAKGLRLGTSESFARREAQTGQMPRQAISITLDDGRRLWMVRPSLDRLRRDGVVRGMEGPGGLGGPGGPGGPPPGERAEGLARLPGGGAPAPDEGMGEFGPRPQIDGGPPGRKGPEPRGLFDWWRGPLPGEGAASVALVALLVLLFLAVAGGAWPVVRGLTRRLERLRHGVEAFGSGALDHRVPEEGSDEVGAVARSFNRAAARIEALVTSNQSLLANASHELRSPLARLKMAVSMLDDAPPTMRASLLREIHTNIGELDALVEEVLLSSRLEAGAQGALDDLVDLVGLGAEEASRVGAELQMPAGDTVLRVRGSERLLRRALRNLLENARRYGGDEVSCTFTADEQGVRLQVCDRGPGVPADQRERIFEPFYRLPGHAEREGGVGLGLALVQQIARAHDGRVACEDRLGGGSCFTVTLPASRRA